MPKWVVQIDPEALPNLEDLHVKGQDWIQVLEEISAVQVTGAHRLEAGCFERRNLKSESKERIASKMLTPKIGRQMPYLRECYEIFFFISMQQNNN